MIRGALLTPCSLETAPGRTSAERTCQVRTSSAVGGAHSFRQARLRNNECSRDSEEQASSRPVTPHALRALLRHIFHHAAGAPGLRSGVPFSHNTLGNDQRKRNAACADGKEHSVRGGNNPTNLGTPRLHALDIFLASVTFDFGTPPG